MTLTDVEFYKKYNPEYNQVLLARKSEEVAPDDMCSFGGCMYETYGEELEYVKKQPVKRIWTIVDGEGLDFIVLAGVHFVNRIGYLITQEEWSDENEEYVM